MELFKSLTNKKFSDIKDYCVEKISDVVANKIDNSRIKYLNGLRGITEGDTTIIIKKDSDDEDDHKKAKETDKDGEGDYNHAIDKYKKSIS